MARPKAFDPNTVLDAAMRQFRARGYAATSVADLVAVTGINRASLYGTFGDKRQLFLACLDHYAEGGTVAILDAGGPPRQTLERALAQAIDRALADAGAGCFITNTVAEFGGRDPEILARARAALAAIENALDRLLRRALADGAIAADADPRARARHLLSALQGLLLLAKVNPDRAALDRGAREAVVAALR